MLGKEIRHIFVIRKDFKWLSMMAIIYLLITFFFSLFLNGCAIRPETEEVLIEALPKGEIVRNATYLEESLTCMDHLFLQANVKNVLVGSDGLPDRTGRVQVGTRDMLISALSKISAKSAAFRFVDYFMDRPMRGLIDLRNALDPQARKLPAPVYYIGGGITQVDSKVITEKYKNGLGFNNRNAYAANLNFNSEQVSSIVSMDMHIGRLFSRQVIPGLEATNSITVTRTGFGGGFEAHYKLHAIPFSVSIDKNEGTHAAARLLIQLSLVESLGKLTGVPYWKCLGIPSIHPLKQQQAWQTYTALSHEARKAAIVKGLYEKNYLSGDGGNKVHNENTLHNAITRYQRDYNLIPDGQLNFNLYYKLTHLSPQPTIDKFSDTHKPIPTPKENVQKELKEKSVEDQLLSEMGLNRDHVDLSPLSSTLWLMLYDKTSIPSSSLNATGTKQAYPREQDQRLYELINRAAFKTPQSHNLSPSEHEAICLSLKKSYPKTDTDSKKLNVILVRKQKDDETEVTITEIDRQHCQ